MKKYNTADGAEYSAVDAVDLVNQLRESSRFDDSIDNASFMASFAERAVTWFGRAPTTISEEAFVADLVDLGYFTET